LNPNFLRVSQLAYVAITQELESLHSDLRFREMLLTTDSRLQILRLRLRQTGSDTLKGDLDVSSGACPQVSN
jgi:hypothetical protein